MSRFDGALLRARREQLGLTIEELSDQTGLTRRRRPGDPPPIPWRGRYTLLMEIESGTIRPSVNTLEKLCRALGVKPSALFSGELDDDADDRPTDLGAHTDQWVKDTLASAPPMSDRQAARISAILFGKAH
jgi:transcriptional regulator with XRE-family HTH domain